jgi:hypothetical protein
VYAPLYYVTFVACVAAVQGRIDEWCCMYWYIYTLRTAAISKSNVASFSISGFQVCFSCVRTWD